MEKSEKFLEDQTGKKKALLELFARTRAKKRIHIFIDSKMNPI